MVPLSYKPIMNSDPLDSLTPSERLVLSALLEHRDQKAIARELDLSPETVKTHLRNAREKTGIRTSFALARAFAEREGHTPGRGIPRQGGEFGDPPPASEGSARRSGMTTGREAAFNEDRLTFDFEDTGFRARQPGKPKGGNRPKALPRLFMVAGLALLLAVIILLALPLSESFQRFADVLDPPKG